MNRCRIAGSPDNVVEQIQELEEITGFGTLAASIPHEGLAQDQTLRCIELLSERVIPAFKKTETKTAAIG